MTTEVLKQAVATVLEGWTLPADARKILETAYWSAQADRPVVVPLSEGQEPVKEPDAWLVIDEEGTPVHATIHPQMAHDHINDALDRAILEAAKWAVRPVEILKG